MTTRNAVERRDDVTMACSSMYVYEVRPRKDNTSTAGDFEELVVNRQI
jgi:hypothetical protein